VSTKGEVEMFDKETGRVNYKEVLSMLRTDFTSLHLEIEGLVGEDMLKYGEFHPNEEKAERTMELSDQRKTSSVVRNLVAARFDTLQTLELLSRMLKEGLIE
jgi:hypothetical protein